MVLKICLGKEAEVKKLSALAFAVWVYWNAQPITARPLVAITRFVFPNNFFRVGTVPPNNFFPGGTVPPNSHFLYGIESNLLN